MKIVILVSSFPPVWVSGTEIATYNIAKSLANLGHEVHVITSLDTETSPDEYKDGFFIHRINFHRKSFLGFAYYSCRVVKLIKNINPKIVQAQAIGSGIYALFSKILLKNNYVIWGRGSDVFLPDSFTRMISSTVLSHASCVIALTNAMKTRMENYSINDVIIIPNGVDLSAFSYSTINEFEDEIINIIFVGRLHSVKGVEYLIKAIALVKDSFNVHLDIIGDGNNKCNLEKLVIDLELSESVSFLGKISNSSIPKYLGKSDIFILPSLSEGFPLVLLEAMAAGLPIIASNVGGIPDVIEDKFNGFLAEPMNSEDIAEKLLILLKNEKLRKQISFNNKNEAKKYSWDQIALNLENIYKSI